MMSTRETCVDALPHNDTRYDGNKQCGGLEQRILWHDEEIMALT